MYRMQFWYKLRLSRETKWHASAGSSDSLFRDKSEGEEKRPFLRSYLQLPEGRYYLHVLHHIVASTGQDSILPSYLQNFQDYEVILISQGKQINIFQNLIVTVREADATFLS